MVTCASPDALQQLTVKLIDNARRRCVPPGRETEFKEVAPSRTDHFTICTSSATCSFVSGAGMNFSVTASAISPSSP
jgi:hypothetical protein